MLLNVPKLVTAYYVERPDVTVPAQRVVFGTSGHRGSAPHQAFNEAHILAATQAICAYRRQRRIAGALFLGKDTHALSESERLLRPRSILYSASYTANHIIRSVPQLHRACRSGILKSLSISWTLGHL